MNQQPVVRRAVVGVEDVHIRNIGRLKRIARGKLRRKQVGAARVAVRAVGVVALLVNVIGAQCPVGAERMLHATRRVNRIRRPVVGSDQFSRPALSVARNASRCLRAARIRNRVNARACRRVHGLESRGPAILRQVVEVEPKARPNYRVSLAAQRPRNAQPRRKLLVIVVRSPAHQRNPQRLERDVPRIVDLASPRSNEQTPRRRVAEPIIEGQILPYAPGILRVNRQPLHVLREAAVACGSVSAGDARRNAWLRIALRGRRNKIKRQWTRDTTAAGSGRIDVAIRVGRILDDLLRSRRKCAAKHRLMNEIHAEFQRMAPTLVAQIVAELVFLLAASGREKRDRRRKLVVAKSFKPRHRQRSRAERKGQRKSKIGVARLRQVQSAAVEDKLPQQRWSERNLIADHQAQIVVVRQQTCRGQSPLLHQVVKRCVVVD